MKKRLLYVLCLTAGFAACKKNSTLGPPNHFGEIFQVSFTLDSVPYSVVCPKDSINGIDGYNYGVDNFYSYFGQGPYWGLSNRGIFEFQLGSAYGRGDSAYASFVNLCSPGSKNFDAMRYADQKLAYGVEITYIDENNHLWSTTKVDASGSYPKPAPVPIQQTGSTFIITSEKEVSFDNIKNNGVLIKGTFNCTLYKYTTYEQKKITNGAFVAVF